jgi:hypothetical protein
VPETWRDWFVDSTGVMNQVPGESCNRASGFWLKLVQKGLGKASVAVARKLGIRLWIMLRDQIEYHEFCRRGQKQQKSSDACAGMPETRYGAKSHRPVD